MAFNPNSDEGITAITFIVVTFVLLVILMTTCIVCWCWRYKLHKRKQEIKIKDAEIGVTTMKPSGCRCCGCWTYLCRCCRGCCEPVQKIKVLNPVQDLPPILTTTATAGACGYSSGACGGNQFGWGKDVIVYNTGTPVPTSTHACSQPVNFSNRWSSANDGRLVLNGGGVVSKVTPGIQTYGGIYPSVPSGISASDQFLLTARRH